MKLLITLFLALVLAAVGLVLFVDPNRYKDLITTKISEEFHHTLTINGTIEWRILPRIGFTLKEVHLENLAEVKEVHVYPRLIPLLNKQIDIDELALTDAKFYLSKQTTITVADLESELHINNQLNGAGNFQLNNGTISGINLGYWLATGESMLKANNLISMATAPLTTSITNNLTDFEKITGTFTINNGIFNNNDLVIHGRDFYATGGGSIDFIKQTIHYTLHISPTQNTNIHIPIIISGNLNHPSVTIDPNGIPGLVINTTVDGIGHTINQASPNQVVKDTVNIVDTVKGLFGQ